MVRTMPNHSHFPLSPSALLRAIFAAILLWPVTAVASGVAPAQFTDPQSDVESIMAASVDRLALMPNVAAWKWRHHQPVADPERERIVLLQTSQQASTLGIDAQSSEALFLLQIRLARQVQERLFEQWRKGGFDEKTADLDLNTVLRPRLDTLGTKLLHAIAVALPELKSEQFAWYAGRYANYLRRSRRLNESDAAQLMDAVSHVRARTMPLQQRILATGVVRIGMTGDYAPFSLEADHRLQGLDVDLALEFAKSLGVQARFVHTSWPSLMTDYAAGRFDLAMSGISITPQRSAIARFSIPYQAGGKTALARCTEAVKFRSLEDIDRSQTRVIVNPGGTNESFVREHLHAARIIDYPDNRTIFNELLAGRADVMITDDIEAELQHRRQPLLCRSSQNTFTKSSKAWLLQPDEQFAARADAWLSKQLMRGVVEKLLEQALGGK